MDLFSILLIVIGLCLFEVIVSVDNAIVNADVLSTMSRWARKWFLLWGFFVAVLVVRGIIPWIVVWVSNPSLGVIGAFTATFSSDPIARNSLEASSHLLLAGGGYFLVLLFFHWYFLEPKNFDSEVERHVQKKAWFNAAAIATLVILLFFSFGIDPRMSLSIAIGAFVFYVTNGFKESAEEAKNSMKKNVKSDISKIIYLEVLDATFSVDSVLGAFAFTLSVPLILIGNGIGVFVVRHLTVSNIKTIARFKYIKNGAMYSIFILSIIMLLDAFGFYVPEWLSPLITLIVVGYFICKK